MAESLEQKAANAVSEERLWDRLMTMAQYGALSNGGVNRQALSTEDIAARKQMKTWSDEHGFEISTDDIGNLFVRRNGTDADAAPVTTGSHIDSQPKGGKFDGIYGVMAGLEALVSLDESGVQTKRPIEVIAWMGEEGSRFQPGLMGSLVFTGQLPPEKALPIVDKDGISVERALQETLDAEPNILRRKTGFPAAAYIETHIEQGPVLEAEEKTIGVVTGIQGIRWYGIEVLGQEAHAGTSPMKTRKDALKAAAEMVGALEQVMEDPTDTVRCTFGRFEVFPGSPNTVPGRVFFTIDFRHPETEAFERFLSQIEPVCRQHARGCEVTIEKTLDALPTVFRPDMVETVHKHTESLGVPFKVMPSGGGHDAQNMNRVCPTGMIFVPCKDGLSHNEAEYAAPQDLAAGTRVLAACLADLANR
ncbi:MAG: M20 family metallo-hydrolase [Alphaproteobacteria bacterium]|nr:M20 family metallo-hydrolase [Alphaproteobacteria bacterium]